MWCQVLSASGAVIPVEIQFVLLVPPTCQSAVAVPHPLTWLPHWKFKLSVVSKNCESFSQAVTLDPFAVGR